jgi:hypothetical protein
MRVYLLGNVVDLDKSDWEINGRSGTAFGVFVSSGKRDQPTRVRVTEAQYLAVGLEDQVQWPVNVIAMESNFGAARLRVTLDQEFDVSATDASGASADGFALAGAPFHGEPDF